MVLVTYDVDFSNPTGAKRLRKVAKICENYGIRVQNSVFEMNIDSTQLTEIKIQINSIIDEKLDSVRFYKLGKKYDTKIETLGCNKNIDCNDTLIL